MESNSGGGGGGEEHAHVVELMATAESDSDSDQIAPLLTHSEKPRINIFSVSYPRRKSNRCNQFTTCTIMAMLSLTSFVYCLQRLPLSQGIILRLESVAARIILREKIKIPEIGGLSCSFFGVLIIFHSMLTAQVEGISSGRMAKAGEASDLNVKGSHQIYALVIGLFSSIAGGISYCLIRAGAKASDQPVVTVFSFGILASPAAAICTLVFQVFLARGLQLEKTSKVANIHYLEAALSQFLGMVSSRVVPSFNRVVGCLLIE